MLWPKLKTKFQLIQEARKCYRGPTYKVQELANSFQQGDFEIEVLFLPIEHPELNPIEMMWGFVKSSVSTHNMSFRLSDVDALAKGELEKFTASEFQKYVGQFLNEEAQYRSASVIFGSLLEDLGDDGYSSDEEWIDDLDAINGSFFD